MNHRGTETQRKEMQTHFCLIFSQHFFAPIFLTQSPLIPLCVSVPLWFNPYPFWKLVVFLQNEPQTHRDTEERNANPFLSHLFTTFFCSHISNSIPSYTSLCLCASVVQSLPILEISCVLTK